MNRLRRINPIVVLSLGPVLLAPHQGARAGFLSDWEASSGRLPDQISPPYTIESNGNATHSLGGGFLTISTASDSDQFLCMQAAPTVDTSKPFFIEARLRYVSGQTGNAARAPAEIFFNTGPGVGNFLWIDRGRVFFDAGTLVVGPGASVDTSGAFHTYRIEYDGKGGLKLLYDGSQILTATTYSSFSDFGSTEQIGWGDGTVLASGTSEWQYFRHNALTAVPGPPSHFLLGAGIGAVVLSRRFRRSVGTHRQGA